ncbi:MAG: hypothetical protein K6C13_01005 [Oscillospiraceae bacterium]|nr:hypothetical protein [Oscillospiraceae bacterium]
MPKRIMVLMLLSCLRIADGVTSYAMNYFRTIDHDLIQMDFAVYGSIDSCISEEICGYDSKI